MVSWFSDLLQTHSTLIIAVGSVSLVTFAGTLLALPLLLIRIPEDYFLKLSVQKKDSAKRNILFHFAKNAIGALFLVMGFIMLFIPGQGLLTILAGLWLMDFPGKRSLEIRLIHRKSIYHAIDFIRRKAGRPPLKL